MRKGFAFASLAATTILSSVAMPAVAQVTATSSNELVSQRAAARSDAPLPSSPAADEQGAEIVVTALKRRTSIQDTPATVSVLSSETLARTGIATIEQLGTVVPGVIIQRPPNNTANATIRGIGTSPGPVSFEQGVALFVDGIYAARGADFLSSLFDIDRLEVVKGTQAAVLGKNTSLGAITLQTRRPGDTFHVNAAASYEFNQKSKQISGGVDIPLTPTLAVRVAGQYQDLGGFQTNRVIRAPAERHARETHEKAGRITAVWKPSGDLTVTASYSHEYLKNIGQTGELVVGSPAALALYTAAGFTGAYETDLDNHYSVYNAQGPTRLRQKSDRATLTATYDVGFGTITSITGYSQFKQNRYIDYDYTPGDYFDDVTYISGKQVSEEVRLSSDHSGPFQYLVGALYVHNSLYQNQFQSVHYPVNPQGAFRAFFDQKTDTYSFFAQPSLRLADGLTVIGGMRYTKEDKSVDMERLRLLPGSYTTVQYPPYPLTRLSRNEGSLDGSMTVQFKPSSRLMIYASWGQGTKSGGFSDFAVPSNAPYKAEVARTAEAGFKLAGPGRIWHLNAAYFHTRVENFQNNLFNGSVFVVQNLDVASDGVELDALWQATRNLRFTVEGTYAKAHNLDHAPGIGDRMPRAPRVAGKAGVDFEAPISQQFRLTVGTNYTYRSRISHQLNPAAVPFGDAFGTVNANIGLRDVAHGAELSLIGRNLADGRSISFAFPTPNAPGAVTGVNEESRTIMLQLKLDI